MIAESDVLLARRVSFDLTDQPIALTEERSGVVRAANPAFLDLVGRCREEVAGRSVIDLGLWTDEGQRNSFLNCLLMEGRLERYPLPPSARFPRAALYANVDVVTDGGERYHLVRIDADRPSFGRDGFGLDGADGLRFLSRTARDFLSDDSAGLQSRIVRELRTMVPRSVVVFSAFDPETDELTLRAMAAPPEADPVIARYSDRYIGGVIARMRGADRAHLLRCELNRDASFPPGATRSDPGEGGAASPPNPNPFGELAAELAVESIWNIALAWDGESFGLVTILLRRGDEAPDRALIETFVRQASAALRRDRRTRSLNSALYEKETLLREIHHRVKNNLQIVASLLNLQTSHTRDEAAVRVLAETADRVQSMALVHTMLYGSASLSSIDAAEYLRTLTTQIVRGANVEYRGVELRFDLDPIVLDADRAVPAGLIVTELVTNALKYGVGVPGPGTITVGLSKSGGSAVIAVSDTGRALPSDFSAANASTLGMQLVDSLTRQLNGTLEASVGEETVFRIHFPV